VPLLHSTRRDVTLARYRQSRGIGVGTVTRLLVVAIPIHILSGFPANSPIKHTLIYNLAEANTMPTVMYG